MSLIAGIKTRKETRPVCFLCKSKKPRSAKDIIRKRLILFWKRWGNKINRLSTEDLCNHENRILASLVRSAYTSMTRQVKCALNAQRKAEYKREALANALFCQRKKEEREEHIRDGAKTCKGLKIHL